jgi:hypothetical protein
MRWGRMYSRYSLEYHHHNLLLVENANVLGVSKYHYFFVKDQSKWPIAKIKKN